jgi:hypothetical protein
MTRKTRSRILMLGAFPAVLVLVPFLAWRTIGFTYSTGERVGFVEDLSSEGKMCDTYEGSLVMSTGRGAPGSTWRFSVRDRRVADQIGEFKGQRVAVHYRQEKGGQLVCSRKTEYIATGVRRID